MAEGIGLVNPELIHLLQVNIIKFNINSSDEYLENPEEHSGIKLSIGKDTAHNFDEGMARYRLYFECEASNAKEENLGLTAEIGIEFHFKVENFSEFIKTGDKGKMIDISIGSSLMAIAYSTSRGIVLEKTQNTFFKGIILPVINSTNFLLDEEKEHTSK